MLIRFIAIMAGSVTAGVVVGGLILDVASHYIPRPLTSIPVNMASEISPSACVPGWVKAAEAYGRSGCVKVEPHVSTADNTN
jgi:hypothetical protein